MRIFGAFPLPFDCEKAYGHLYDPAILARCVPGCDEFEKTGEADEFAVGLKLELPPFMGQFSGHIKIIEAVPPSRFRILAEGSGLIGSLKGEGVLTLAPGANGADCELTYDGDVQVGGSIVSAGQRVIDSTAKLMIRKFFEKFIEEARAL